MKISDIQKLLTVSSAARFLCVATAAACLLFYTEAAAMGVSEGLLMCARTIVPTMFPMMLLCSYALKSGADKPLGALLGRAVSALFGLSPQCTGAILAGAIGGYPAGAAAIASLYKSSSICAAQAQRLFLFAINGGPAFIISAIGFGMLGNLRTGAVIYVCILLSGTVLGIFLKLFGSRTDQGLPVQASPGRVRALTGAVSESSQAIFGVCSWVVAFSCMGGVLEQIIHNEHSIVLIRSILEVSTGAKSSAELFGAPGAAAAAAFGGISVLCQIMPYADLCGVELKKLLAFRVAHAALSAFFTGIMLRIFPSAAQTVTAGISVYKAAMSYSVPAAAALLLMCALFILDVDYSRKKC